MIPRSNVMERSMKQPYSADNQSIQVPRSRRGNPWENPSGLDIYHGSRDASLFSSSLPVLGHEKLSFVDANPDIQTIVNASSNQHNVQNNLEDGTVAQDDLDPHGIRSLLPGDEDDLLAGITDDFDLSGLPSQLEDLEEDDVFGSGGGMEMDFDPTDKLSVAMARTSIIDGYVGNGTNPYSIPNGVGAVAGEHPYGEHPSRTLFVRNINSNVEDSELRALFEQHGDIRTLYTACKHRGFVMISYYDIRAARTAMRALQNKPLRRRKLDIHFSIPKDNPSDKDVNQGTLVVFNLDPSVSNDDLRQIFGDYGEVKEIRETPHKRHHKFIEFYDVRAAEAALRALNRSDIAGKRIKLEPSRPGGARRTLMQQWNQELEQDDARSFLHQVGSPIASSPPGTWAQFGSPGDGSPLHSLSQSPTLGTINPLTADNVPGLASILPPISKSIKIPPIGKTHNRGNYLDLAFNSSNPGHGHPFQHSHSLPEHGTGILSNMTSSPGSLSSFGHSTAGTSAFSTLTGPQFLWGSPNPYSDQPGSSAWPVPSLGHSFTPNGQDKGFPYSSQNTFVTASQPYTGHHVGSAPSGLPLERKFGYFRESPDASFMNPGSFGAFGFSRNDPNLMMNISNRASITSPSLGISGNVPENGSSGFRMIPSQRMGHMFIGGSPYPGLMSSRMESLIERAGNRRVESNGSQIESKKQYQLELDKILRGEDNRTTLMIKNIPNKYTSKMLLAAIDEHHKGTYDFLYLPIDFKNKCNVGYAFINMVSAAYIVPFYEAFNGKKWEKFNSEKVASLAYARIQGKAALVSHFQNSSLMNEDKRCRPILFHSEGPDAGDQEPFPNNCSSSIEIQINSSEMIDRMVSPEAVELRENTIHDSPA